jgi:UDP-N-acetylglucosamine 1-carboxyvinyltransferase
MFVIRGGIPLRGSVRVSGAKNAALPIMAACLAADGLTTLSNVPNLVDVRTLAQLIEALGANVRFNESTASHLASTGVLQIEATDCQRNFADYELVRKMRASVCVLGPLLGKRGQACVSLPGGCNIGHRPIDLHLKGLEALGADIRVERGYVFAKAKRLKGASIYLGGPFGSTVTGTCNVMTAACLAEGITTISAAACEPEVVDLGHFLIRMGADIEGLGTPLVRIKGVGNLTGTTYEIVPDRIEAATLIMAAAMTKGHVCIQGLRVEHLAAVIDLLRSAGVSIECTSPTEVQIQVTGSLKPVDCTALPYPGIPTDLQAQLTALLSQAQGISVVTDKVFPDRFMHIPELVRLGAHIRREGASGIIVGGTPLSGACVMASDLRASAALVLAALAASGDSVIRRIYHLDRGYEAIEEKLCLLGGNVMRVVDRAENLPMSLRSVSTPQAEDEEGSIEVPSTASSDSTTGASSNQTATIPQPKFLRSGIRSTDVDPTR